MLQWLKQRTWDECHQILGAIHIPLGRQQCDAMAVEIGHGIGQGIGAGPARLGKWFMRAARPKTHQPIATVQSRAKHRIRPPQRAEPGGDIGGAKAGDVAANQNGAREGGQRLFHASPQIASSLRHARRAGHDD